MPSYFHLSILPLISITKNVATKRTASWHPKAIALYFLQQNPRASIICFAAFDAVSPLGLLLTAP